MGPVTLITGATGGLGHPVTKAFLSSGARVAGVSRKIQDSDFEHENFKAFPAELNSASDAQTLVDAVIERFESIDTVVHLVGAFAGGESVADTDEATVERMFSVNFNSAFHLFRAVIPHLRANGSGRILAIGSRVAVEAAPLTGAYAASKAALVSLVRSVALENKDRDITANIVLPGTMDTPANREAMPDTDFSHWVSPQQVAALLVHLASPLASHISGSVIPIYGKEL